MFCQASTRRTLLSEIVHVSWFIYFLIKFRWRMKDAILKKKFKDTTENSTVITAPYPIKVLNIFKVLKSRLCCRLDIFSQLWVQLQYCHLLSVLIFLTPQSFNSAATGVSLFSSYQISFKCKCCCPVWCYLKLFFIFFLVVYLFCWNLWRVKSHYKATLFGPLGLTCIEQI